MKEQYAYFYRASKVSLVGVRLYPDHDNDFERPPYLARFRDHQSREDFTLIGIHVDPDEAYYEIEGLSGLGRTSNAQCENTTTLSWVISMPTALT